MPCSRLQTALSEGLLSQCDTVLLILLTISGRKRREEKRREEKRREEKRREE
ncbi:MAG: hypothetical protein ICV56_04810, partial [Nitrososphaeraceae archaeon]|nr:hypothetical protein [Nitrososphaeraceae archaeon]